MFEKSIDFILSAMALPIIITENKRLKIVRVFGILFMLPWCAVTAIPLGILLAISAFLMIIEEC